jgi:hypothetical protein
VTFANCVDNAVFVGDAPVTFEHCIFKDNKATKVTDEGSTGGVLLLAFETYAEATDTQFSGTAGYDVILQETSSILYTDLDESRLMLAPSGNGKVKAVSAVPASASMLSGSDSAFTAIQQV